MIKTDENHLEDERIKVMHDMYKKSRNLYEMLLALQSIIGISLVINIFLIVGGCFESEAFLLFIGAIGVGVSLIVLIIIFAVEHYMSFVMFSMREQNIMIHNRKKG